MAVYTLKFRRGTSIPSLSESEPFFKTDSDTLHIGNGSTYISLVKLDESNAGSLSLTGDITASNALLSGDITIQGNIILGDSVANDNININAELSGSLIPDADNEHDLGSSSKKWKNLHAVSASIQNVSFPGSDIVSGSTDSSTIDFSVTDMLIYSKMP